MSSTTVERAAPEHDAAIGSALDSLLWAVRHRTAAELEETAPGPALAARLAALERADLDDAALVEGVAAWERVASWVAAGQARLVAELSRRRRGERAAFLGDEVAARLPASRHVGEAKVGLALQLDRLPAVADALARGDLDVRRATVLTDELARLSDEAAGAVADAVLPAARECTAPQLKQRLRRMELRRDPDGARKRHVRARADRHVELTPVADSMAWLSAYLPADDATAIHTSLTALAGDAAPGDERTLDQRRADALVDLSTRWLDAGLHPDGTPLTTRQGRRPHLVVTASAATLLGLADGPGELEGYGPIPPEMARRLAARSTWEPLLADARTGEPLARSTRRYAPTQSLRDAVVLRDRTCTFVGCPMPAARCDVDHVEPHVDRGDEAGPELPAQTAVENLQALCRHHHRAKTHGGWDVERDEDGATRWRPPTGQAYRRTAAHAPPAVPPAPPPPEGVSIDLYPPPGDPPPPF